FDETTPNEDFVGAGAFAFDRTKMLVGDPTATFVYFQRDLPDGGMLPSDLDGSTLPPVGSPNYFLEIQDDAFGPPITHDQLWLYKFHADFVNPSNSTFTGPTQIDTAPFDSNMC